MLSWTQKPYHDLILYKCLCCNRNYRKKFDGNLKKIFADTYKFSDHDILFCCCEKVFSHGWLGKIRWNIITTEKNSKSIKHTGYTNAKKVCIDLEIKNLGKSTMICMFKMMHYC